MKVYLILCYIIAAQRARDDHETYIEEEQALTVQDLIKDLMKLLNGKENNFENGNFYYQ